MRKLISLLKAVPALVYLRLKALPTITWIALKRVPGLALAGLKVLPRFILACISMAHRFTFAALKTTAVLLMCGVLFTMLLRNLHRQGVSSIQVEKNLPKLLPAKKYDWNRSVVRLYNDEGFFCSGVVIGANYVLTAAHCLVDENGVMKRQRVIVENDDGTIRLTSKPVGVNLRMDWGLLESDFSDIPAAEVWESGFEPQAQVLACGYPQGSKTLNCQVLVPVMNDAFLVKCAVGGMLFPGMSGGPVFDKAGHVLGLNTAMYPAEEDGGTAYSPTIGILANFHIAD